MTSWTLPSDAEIGDILRARIDFQGQGVGIVVGVIDAGGRRVVSHGALAKSDARPLNGETLFEIGSITKAFTSLLLQDAVERGEVALDDPVARFLPAGVTVPERAGRRITLADLATHTSALPRIPGDMPMADRANPYADYTVEQLYAFLSNHDLRRDIGKAYEYSNLGAGLLGHALARRAGMDYEALVRERITGPLGMDSTVVSLTPELSARMAQGHDDQLKPTSNWDIPTLAGAGALRSTANDLLNLLAAELGFLETPLAPAMRAQYGTTHETDIPNIKIALGWHITTVRDREIVWHNGGSGGFRCFLGFDRAEGLGAVVLTNLANMAGADDVGFHLLRGSPVAVLTPPEPKRVRQAIALPSEVLQAYAGVYQISPNMRVTVTRDGQRLLAQLSGAPNEIFPESRTDFFWKVVDAQITFHIDVDGRVTGATLHQGGRHTPAKRVEA